MENIKLSQTFGEAHKKRRVPYTTGVASICRANENHRSIIHCTSCCGDYDFTFITAWLIMMIRSLFT